MGDRNGGRVGAVVDRRRRAASLPDFMEDHPGDGLQLVDIRQRAVDRNDGLAIGIMSRDDAVDWRQRHGGSWRFDGGWHDTPPILRRQRPVWRPLYRN